MRTGAEGDGIIVSIQSKDIAAVEGVFRVIKLTGNTRVFCK